jgi:5'-AMP-activated protein kinase catalytic alpha subunit
MDDPGEIQLRRTYKELKVLGVGSFCKVKLGVHILTDTKVAIKILNRRKLASMDMGDKIRTEIDILAKCRHPHVVRLYEVIESKTAIFSIMEYVSEGELFEYIVKKQKLDESECLRLFQQVISGLDYCHANMVCHRDLKPENLLLDSEYRLKIVDFGFASRMRDGYWLSTSCGSPNYAAPEVISGQPYAGPEVDVWSAGVILFATLCGRLPFDDEDIRALFKNIRSGQYTVPSHVSAGPRALLAKMLDVDPAKRITLSEIRQDAWYNQDLPPYLQATAQVPLPCKILLLHSTKPFTLLYSMQDDTKLHTVPGTYGERPHG